MAPGREKPFWWDATVRRCLSFNNQGGRGPDGRQDRRDHAHHGGGDVVAEEAVGQHHQDVAFVDVGSKGEATIDLIELKDAA